MTTRSEIERDDTLQAPRGCNTMQQNVVRWHLTVGTLNLHYWYLLPAPPPPGSPAARQSSIDAAHSRARAVRFSCSVAPCCVLYATFSCCVSHATLVSPVLHVAYCSSVLFLCVTCHLCSLCVLLFLCVTSHLLSLCVACRLLSFCTILVCHRRFFSTVSCVSHVAATSCILLLFLCVTCRLRPPLGGWGGNVSYTMLDIPTLATTLSPPAADVPL